MKFNKILVGLATLLTLPLYLNAQTFEGTIRYTCKVESENPTFSAFFPPAIEFIIKGDSIRKNNLFNSEPSAPVAHLVLNNREYFVNYVDKEVLRAIYPDTTSRYEGEFKPEFFKRSKERKRIGNHECVLYDYITDNTRSKQQSKFWIDESFAFKISSGQKLIVKDIGLVVRAEIYSPTYSMLFTVSEIKKERVNIESFTLPFNYPVKDFHPPLHYLER